MTTVVLSPPSGPASSSATVPSSKSVLIAVAATKPAKEPKDVPSSDSDSPTTTAIGLGLDQVEGMEPEEEEEEEEEEEDDDEDDENIERRANGAVLAAAAMDPARPNKKRRRVSFECADIVEFEPTVYTTSVTSGGVPVGLSLNERSRSRRRLDSFELERESERVGRQNYMEEGYLDPQEREIILNNAGCEEPVIASVEAEVNAIIQHRLESNEVDFDFMYGAGEMEEEVEEEVEEAEEEDEESSNVLSYELDGAAEEVQEESEEELENSAEEDAAAVLEVTEDAPPASTSSEDSVDEEMHPASSETTVHPCSDDVPEAASI